MTTEERFTQASNPGRVAWERKEWLNYYPMPMLIWFLLIAGLVTLACITQSNFFAIPVVLLLPVPFIFMGWIRQLFWHGCINPAVVVSLDPLLIAVYTDMSKGFGNYPVVKILKIPRQCIEDGELKKGSRLATVAFYFDKPKKPKPHWVDFKPYPVLCGTSDTRTLTRTFRSIPDVEWQLLETTLPKVPKPYQPGLYFIDRAVVANLLDQDEQTAAKPS